jgi:ribosome-binding protein aMBF1 (putative translation factor)
MPKCMICEKERAVLEKAIIGGPIVDVCPGCLNYGKKVDITEVDKIIVHSPCKFVRHVFLGSCKGD